MRVVSGNLGSNTVSTYCPDLDASLIPGVSAAGFELGESISTVVKKIGAVSWYESDSSVDNVLAQNSSWVGLRLKCGSAIELDETVFSYVYLNETISLYFEGGGRLYRVAVGKGYRGSFNGIKPGDDLRPPDGGFDILFNDMDDDFLLVKDEKILEGISFVTDYRASLEHAPEQAIQFISIHNWSLR